MKIFFFYIFLCPRIRTLLTYCSCCWYDHYAWWVKSLPWTWCCVSLLGNIYLVVRENEKKRKWGHAKRWLRLSDKRTLRERERESSRYNSQRVASIIINLRILPFVVEIIQYFLEGFPIQNVILSFYALPLPQWFFATIATAAYFNYSRTICIVTLYTVCGITKDLD